MIGFLILYVVTAFLLGGVTAMLAFNGYRIIDSESKWFSVYMEALLCILWLPALCFIVGWMIVKISKGEDIGLI